jgi:chromate transporter
MTKETPTATRQDRQVAPAFAEALRFWLKLGLISFGGPTGQIAIMQTELVERKKWISQSRFLHALNFCMLLPGPEAQQLAIYVGWLLHKTWGGIVAGALFVIPSIFVLWTLSYIYAATERRLDRGGLLRTQAGRDGDRRFRRDPDRKEGA